MNNFHESDASSPGLLPGISGLGLLGLLGLLVNQLFIEVFRMMARVIRVILGLPGGAFGKAQA